MRPPRRSPPPPKPDTAALGAGRQWRGKQIVPIEAAGEGAWGQRSQGQRDRDPRGCRDNSPRSRPRTTRASSRQDARRRAQAADARSADGALRYPGGPRGPGRRALDQPRWHRGRRQVLRIGHQPVLESHHDSAMTRTGSSRRALRSSLRRPHHAAAAPAQPGPAQPGPAQPGPAQPGPAQPGTRATGTRATGTRATGTRATGGSRSGGRGRGSCQAAESRHQAGRWLRRWRPHRGPTSARRSSRSIG